MPLRDYQERAIADVYASLRQHQSVILQQPTGSGKTHVAMGITKHGLQHDRRIAFGVDRLTLLDQTLDRFYADGIEVGVMQGDHPLYRPGAPVQLISLQTMKRRPHTRWPDFDLFFHDEAHDQHQVVYEAMERRPLAKFVGLSATPFTTGLGLHWEDLVVATTTAELIERGYLSPYKAYGPSAPNMAGARIYGSDWANTDVQQRMEPLTGNIVTHYQSMTPGQKALVFAANVQHAKDLAAAFEKEGIAASYVHGKDSDERRREVLDAFAAGDIRVLCNCEVLTKGYDQPDVTVGIIARPTRSLALHIQILGRVLRTSPGKEFATILDHAGNIARLGFPDDPLPTKLSDKDRGVSEIDRREGDEPEPWNCPKCTHLNPPRTIECNACGERRVRQQEVQQQEGVLKELSREGRADKQTVHAMLKQIAHERNYKDGWVAHSYKSLFGKFPDREIKTNVRMRASFELRQWVNERMDNQRKAFYARARARERAANRGA